MVLIPPRADDQTADTRTEEPGTDPPHLCRDVVVLLGGSAAARRVSRSVAQAAGDSQPVLLLAEGGQDVERIASEIHRTGADAGQPFIGVDCAQASSSETERLVFGDTPDEARREDLEAVASNSSIVAAGRGVLFLSHVLDLSDSAQRRLARLLRDGEMVVTPPGHRRPFEARVIAAAGPDLRVELREGRFRSDLHRRLSGVVIDIPPLRERAEDLPRMAKALAREAAAAAGCRFCGFTQTALTLLAACPWRDNVDELRGLLERVVASAGDRVIRIEDVLAHVRLDGRTPPVVPDGTLREARRRFEREYISATLAQHEGRMGDAARALGIQRTNLYRKVRQLGVTRRTGANELS